MKKKNIAPKLSKRARRRGAGRVHRISHVDHGGALCWRESASQFWICLGALSLLRLFFHGRQKAKGFYAVFLPLLFCIGFLATAVSFGVIHMNGLGFTGENIGIYASAYYGECFYSLYGYAGREHLAGYRAIFHPSGHILPSALFMKLWAPCAMECAQAG